MSPRYHNDLTELSLRSLRSRDVSTASMSVNFIMHSRVFLDSFQSVHNTIWTMAVVQQQAGLLLGLIYLEQIQEDEDLINLLRRRRQRRAARRRRTWVRQWLDVAEGFILVNTIGSCLNCGMRTLQVFLTSSVCHPPCLMNFLPDWFLLSPNKTQIIEMPSNKV